MSNFFDKRLYSVVDIGHSKTRVIVFVLDDNIPKVVGLGISTTQGISKGQIVDIDKVSKSIYDAVSQAEIMVGSKINEFITGISSNNLSFINNNATVTIYSKEVLESDKLRVMEAAQRTILPDNSKIIHAIPQNFILNKGGGNSEKVVDNPVGQTGAVRLDAQVYLIVANADNLSNLNRCFEKCGIKLKKNVANILGLANGILTNSELDQARLIINIGAEITDIILIFKGTIIYSGGILSGGNDITRDISLALGITLEQAEEIKKKYGCAYSGVELNEISNQTITYKTAGKEQKISRATLSEIIYKSYSNIFYKIQSELSKTAILDRLDSHIEIFLTGGASKMEGLESLSNKIFRSHASIKNPRLVESSGLDDIIDLPDNTTAIGIMYSYLDELGTSKNNDIIKSGAFLPKFWHWFKENF